MRKIGDMLRLSAAGLLRLRLAQIMHCATRASRNQISALSHAADAERVVDIRNDTLIKIEHEQCQDMSRPRRPLARMLSDFDLIFKSLEFPG